MAFVGEVVVLGTERDQVLEVGHAAIAPLREVVDVAVTEAHGTVGCGAGAVHGAECSALVGGGEASGSADVEDLAVAAEHDRDDLGLTRQPSHRRRWERLT